jgi:DNA-binding transcriptional regulator of glucitol operon
MAVDSLSTVRRTQGTPGSAGTANTDMWTSGRAVSLHVALVIFVPGCVALTWWQVTRALGGNTLSWVYTFEWPIFGSYAIYMWWKLVHDVPAADAPAPDGPVAEAPPRDRPLADPSRQSAGAADDGRQAGDDGGRAGPGTDEDDELAAYNRYLTDLNASGRQKRW